LLSSKKKFSQIWLKTKDESATFKDSSIFGYLLKPDVKYEPTIVIKRKSKFDNRGTHKITHLLHLNKIKIKIKINK